MSLHVEYLEVREFRNYEWFLLELDKGITILQGPNAVGKTNLIEALHLLCAGRSFRNPIWADTIRRGSLEARLSLVARDTDREVNVVLDISADTGRTYRLNGSKKKSVSAATGSVPCVLFTPDDLQLVKGPSEQRRAAIDALGGQLSPTYERLRKEYGRILRQRNRSLKASGTHEELAVWGQQLSLVGASLMKHRAGLLMKLVPHAKELYADLTDKQEFLDISYKPSWSDGEEGDLLFDGDEVVAAAAIADGLERSAEQERRRGTTLVGPHKDDVLISVDGNAARTFASQGQQRSIALAWKLAEVRAVEEILRQRPILLLDDVMSELDGARRDALAGAISKSVQTVITTTNLQYFNDAVLQEGRVVSLG